MAGFRLPRSVGLLSPSLGANAICFVVPLVYFFVLSFLQVRSFQVVFDPTTSNYVRVLQQYSGPLVSTLSLAVTVAAIVTVIGFIYASACRFIGGSKGGWLLAIAMITLFGGYLAKLYAWRTILGENGILNTGLIELGLIQAPITALLYNNFAVVLALTHYTLPLAILPIYGSLRAIEDLPIAAARDLGATDFRILKDIIVPQCATGLFSAFAMTLLFVAGDAIAPRLLGGTSSSMVGVFIQDQFGFRVNAPMGSALAFTVIAGSAIILLIIGLGGGRLVRQGDQP
ncbi:spermidine/putrescine transport system permease protein [Mesorhizobium soli]|uniref:ABC transporter permease n=1 Tax=Pseudaminobacter soli (ex Li et al. 2025) TaxID=1295366 RepID=UPI002473C85C|nr:ABC transporter permease [Mesorhizobium soli]MDH6233765.1 spermidine/putrescine transport system permease protein [Mesorhizobium soli]